MGKLPTRLRQVVFIFLLIFSVVILTILLGEIIFQKLYPFPAKINYGVTFSPRMAQNLKLDWQQTYLKILDELKVRNLRVPTYWDEVEAVQDRFDFSRVDFMLDQAKERDAKVILVLGARQPRWPECHIPTWAKNLSVKERQKKTLEFVGRVVERYKHHTAILAWQVENEPMLRFFGKCADPPSKNFLKSEVDLVKKLNGKEVIITASGDLETWITPMKLSDIFGTTLYRKVYNPVIGYISYPYPSFLYNLKSSFVRALFAPSNLKTIISELQAEPWSPTNDFIGMPLGDQLSLFSIDDFKEYVQYAKGTGFDTAYLWGVEWWFWMVQQGHPQYLEYAKSLFR